MIFRDRSLSVWLTASLFTTVFVISAIVILIGYYNSHTEGRQKLEDKAEEYLQFLLNTLEPAIWNVDSKLIQSIGDFYAQNEIISALRIVDNDGVVLFDYASSYTGEVVSQSKKIVHDTYEIGFVELSLATIFYKEVNKKILLTSTVTLFFVLATLSLATGLFLRKYMKSPLESLIRGSERIAGGDYQYRFKNLDYREIRELAAKFNEMAEQIGEREKQLENEIAERQQAEETLKGYRDHLEELVEERTAVLEETHRELIDTARRVGMAEVATGVLHNVGNVLNHVGVTTASMSKRIRESRVSYLANIAGLLQEHREDLGAFLTSDERGRKLPGFVVELSKGLTQEQDNLRDEVEKLSHHIQHMTEIIDIQQTFGRISGLEEWTRVSDLLEDAVRINDAAITRHRIEVKREYTPLPRVLVDRVKALQILTNLISNAKNALSESDCEPKLLTLRIPEPDAEELRIEVIDSGVGIAADCLTQIFSYGFTTRENGHGFGLHSGALAAKEMQGRLTVESAGPGTGATFTLTLPYKPEISQHV